MCLEALSMLCFNCVPTSVAPKTSYPPDHPCLGPTESESLRVRPRGLSFSNAIHMVQVPNRVTNHPSYQIVSGCGTVLGKPSQVGHHEKVQVCLKVSSPDVGAS